MAAAVPLDSFQTFGELLHYLRRRARLTQRDLAIAVGYSEAHISRLESNQRLPDQTTLLALVVPALDLDDDPPAVARLLELAAAARGESLAGTSVTITRTTARRSASDLGALEAVPALPAALVRREAALRLRQRLDHNRCVLLCGWAGVGKTTLAATLAHAEQSRPVFWLTFADPMTATVAVLVRQLALFIVAQGDDSVLFLAEHAPDADAAPPLDQQLLALSAALARIPALLCFDNGHVAADNAELLQALQHLVACSPALILLISREQLSLTGVAAFTLGGLTRPEAQRLLNALHPQLAADHAAAVIDHTAGNPMLLRLALGQLADAGDGAMLIGQLATAPHVASYLVQTTLIHAAPDTRQLLALLAVLGQPVDLYAESLLELRQAMVGPINWRAAVEELTRRYLIDNPARAALPPLLRDHVYASLIDDLAQRRRLHQVAAEWLEATDGDPVAMARHYARADLPQAATATLASNLERILDRGQSEAAAAVIDLLLPSARRSRPELLLPLLGLRGDVLVHTLRAAEAETSYREALALATQPAVRAHLVWRMASSLLQRGHVAETLRLAEETQAALIPGDTILRPIWPQRPAKPF
jgi:ATP/maltotriose-dependent transcriptional regulator MalT/DNA-binding XRE family transcriptional regulator